jgi:hypothetical protein
MRGTMPLSKVFFIAKNIQGYVLTDCLKTWKPQPPGTLRDCQGCNGIALLYVLIPQIILFLFDLAVIQQLNITRCS